MKRLGISGMVGAGLALALLAMNPLHADRVIFPVADHAANESITVVSGEWELTPALSQAPFLEERAGALTLLNAAPTSEFAIELRPEITFAGPVRVSLAYPITANARSLRIVLASEDPIQSFPVELSPDRDGVWNVVGLFTPTPMVTPVFRLEAVPPVSQVSTALPINVTIDAIRFDAPGIAEAPVAATTEANPFAVEIEAESPFVVAQEDDDPFATTEEIRSPFDTADFPMVSPIPDDIDPFDVSQAENPFAVDPGMASPFDTPGQSAAPSPFDTAPLVPAFTGEAPVVASPFDGTSRRDQTMTVVATGSFDLARQGLPRPRPSAPPTAYLPNTLISGESIVFAASGRTRPSEGRLQVAFEERVEEDASRTSGEVNWSRDLESALERARSERRPVLLVFLDDNRQSEQAQRGPLRNTAVTEVMNRMVPVRLDLTANADLAARYKVTEAPYAVVLHPMGHTRAHLRLNRPDRVLRQDLQVLLN